MANRSSLVSPTRASDGLCWLDSIIVELLPQHEGAGFKTVFGLSMAAFGIALIASVMFVVIGKKNRVRTTSSWHCKKCQCLTCSQDLPSLEYAFTAVLFSGSTFIAISSIFWFLLPDSDYICHLRVWFLTFGMTLILATMFSRTWLYLRIYNVVHVSLLSKFFTCGSDYFTAPP